MQYHDALCVNHRCHPYPGAMFLFFSNKPGCLGSLLISVVLSLIVILALRGCSGVF